MWNPGPRHGSLVEGKNKSDRRDRVCPFHFGTTFHVRCKHYALQDHRSYRKSGVPGKLSRQAAVFGRENEIRGCKPHLQQGALDVLDTIISSAAPADLELRLLPKIPACNSASFGAARCSHSAVCCELFVSGKIRCHDLDVDLQSLESFLGFMGWLPRSVYILSLVWTVGADERWQKFALISPAQRKLQAGQCIPTVSSLSSLRVFILNTTARSPPAQPRLLHYANPADRRSL